MNAAEQLIEQGVARAIEQGRAGVRLALEAPLRERGVPLGEVGRARLAACADVRTLTEWTTRAATAASEAELVSA